MTKTEKTVRKFMSETMPFTYKNNENGFLMTTLANFYDWLEGKKKWVKVEDANFLEIGKEYLITRDDVVTTDIWYGEEGFKENGKVKLMVRKMPRPIFYSPYKNNN